MDKQAVADALHVSPSTVQRYVDQGDLKPVEYSEYLQRPKKHQFTPEAVEELKKVLAARKKAKQQD